MPVKPVEFGRSKRKDDAKAHAWKAPKVIWPAAGSAAVQIAPTDTAVERAGRLPVGIARTGKAGRGGMANPATVNIAVADRAATAKAGVDGVLLSLKRTDAAPGKQSVQVRVDYSSFRGAYGGDWAARLRLVKLPACVLTAPQQPECRISKPLKTANDTRQGTLTAQTDVAGAPAVRGTNVMSTAPTVLAATAGASGSSGSYKATPLQSSGSWSAGGATGAFNWSYPISVPAVPGGLQPNVSLGYSSQAVDGRTAISNNQPSWVGDGWSWEPGFIERRYKACNDDKDGGTNTDTIGDQCWYNDNATLSLGGKSTELVYDKAKGWHPAFDSGEKVEKLTGASNPDKGTTGVDGQGEHWKITTTDGTQYFFGLNQLPGWSANGEAADDPVTNSTLTTPVFGNHSGEPCYSASFASAWCQQAWRWQLDYVVDPHGNAMAYYWKTEGNNYGRNVSNTTGKATATPYTRAGYLDHIEYGLRADSVYTAKAMGRVDFKAEERCLTACGTFDAANAKNWPDVPYDQYCKDGAECKNQYAPSFWSRMRLDSITTKVFTGGTYKEVDSWKLKHGFPAAGDGISTPLWLESITRTGKVGGSQALPAVTFEGEQKANRVDKTGDGLAPFIRLRLSRIVTETGGATGVYYSDPDCTATSLPATDASNTTRCYPVKWAFEGDTAKLDWFNSYVATMVVEDDNLAATPNTETTYTYAGGAEWAKSTDEITKAEDRTYSVGRGYGLVQARRGAGAGARSLTETRYFRGMDGVAVKDSAGVAVTDRDQFAGKVRESATYNGDDTSKLVSATSFTPWRSAATATRARTGLPDLEAYRTGTEQEDTRTAVTGGERKTSLTRTFDAYGMADSVSETGDAAKSGDEQCLTTTYVRNTDIHLLNKIARTEAVAAPCGTPITRPADVISDVRTYYDGATALTTAPVKGNVTRTEKINGAGNGYDTVMTVSATDYDVYGRALAARDALGERTTTAYTPTAGEAPTKTLVTNPLGHQVTTELEPLRLQPVKVTDANGRVASTVYDPLGRVSKAWLPTRSAATYPESPNHSFDYQVRRDGPSVVTTSTLNHNSIYQKSYAFTDGLQRELQTQTPSPDDKGRLVSEVFYNSLGQAVRSSGTYYADGSAEPVPVTGLETRYPASTETKYDGAGRTVEVIAKRFGDPTKRTTTIYTGDTTTVVPPRGGTTTATVTDARGRTVALKQYTDAARETSQTTTYSYNKHGRLEQVTDPSKAVWKYGYDVAGREIRTQDPDKGTTETISFNKGDQPTDVKDARGIVLHTDYDALGRRTALKQGTTTRATWTYDKASKGLGQVSSTTRYEGTAAYTSEVVNYNALYKPVVSKVTIPAAEGTLAGTYQWTDVYNPNTGQLMETAQPAAGGLPAEDVVNAYAHHSSLPKSVSAGSDPILSSATYDRYGRPVEEEYGNFAQHLWTKREFDDHTGDVTRAFTVREVAPQRIEDTRYAYDPAGNVTQIATVYDQDTTLTSDTQCFAFDALRRITEAWTNTGEKCATTPSDTVVGGPDAYWTSYTYDAVGNRKTETQHRTASGPTADTVRTYAEPATGKHNLPGVTQTGTGAGTETYSYDTAGNTQSRTFKQGTTVTLDQTLDWDTEGRLKTVTKGTDKTSYVYDTGGQRLIRRDSTGTTLYLPGGNELHMDKVGLVTGTRYYDANGKTVAMRTGGKLTFLLSDHHGTSTTQVTGDAAQAVTRRKTTIFGAPRGTQPTDWQGDKGFVGGTMDTDTRLTHLGAREYDPVIGRFISVDPVLDLADPQQAHGYTYSNNNPVTYSDPTGLCPADLCGIGTPKGDGSGDIITEGPIDPGNSTTGYCHKGKCSGGNPDADLRRGKSRHEIFPGVTVPNNWRGEEEFTAKFYAFYMSSVGTMWGAYNDEFYTDRSNMEAAGQLRLWVRNICARMDTCPGGVNKFALHATAPGASLAGLFLGAMGNGVRGIGSKGPKGARSEGCTKCFLAGTDVKMADGSTRDIEKIKVGDEVLATNPLTGEDGARKVTGLIVTDDDKRFNELTIATRQGPKKLTATYEHPFWSPSEKRWIEAGDLKPGMTLLTDSEATVTVQDNRAYTKHARTYNLTVDDLHTYYVLAGKTPVLVHNAGECPVTGLPHGALGESATLQRLQNEGYTNITREVRFKNSQGDVFRADFVAQNPSGNWVAVEVKTGRGASLTDNQALGYAELGHGGAVLNTSRVPGLKKGSTVTMKVEVDLWRCPDC